MLPRLVHMRSIVRVVNGTDGRRKGKDLGVSEKKARANERQKEVQWMRKVRYREEGDSSVSQDGAENRRAGVTGRMQDMGSDLHLPLVLLTPTNHPTQLSSNPSTNTLPLPPCFTSDWK